MSRRRELFATDVPPWELDAQGECRAARVVFSEAPHGPLDYRVPDELLEEVQVGVRVKVPLGRSNREMLGYCIAVETIQQSPEALKPVTEVFDAEPLCTPRDLGIAAVDESLLHCTAGASLRSGHSGRSSSSAGSRQRMVLYPTEKRLESRPRLRACLAKQQEVAAALDRGRRGRDHRSTAETGTCSALPSCACDKLASS